VRLFLTAEAVAIVIGIIVLGYAYMASKR